MLTEGAEGVLEYFSAFSAFDGIMAHVLNHEGMKVGW
jgi:hypothetical protein